MVRPPLALEIPHPPRLHACTPVRPLNDHRPTPGPSSAFQSVSTPHAVLIQIAGPLVQRRSFDPSCCRATQKGPPSLARPRVERVLHPFYPISRIHPPKQHQRQPSTLDCKPPHLPQTPRQITQTDPTSSEYYTYSAPSMPTNPPRVHEQQSGHAPDPFYIHFPRRRREPLDNLGLPIALLVHAGSLSRRTGRPRLRLDQSSRLQQLRPGRSRSRTPPPSR